MNKKVLSLFGAAFIGCAVYAQEKTQDSVTTEQLETVYLDTKIKQDREKSGKVIYKITQEDLQKVQGQSLAQTINTVSGIEITGSRSVQGQNLSYRIRGGNNNQVVILIDGIQVNDPSSINSDFDLRLLDENLIESIEIIKGGVSTLYGTGATTAVISITTKKPVSENIAGTVDMSMGSNRAVVTDKYDLNTASAGANINGSMGKFSYLLAGNIENANGISAARSADASILFQDDPFLRENAMLKLGYKVTDNFIFNTFANYNRFKSNYDGGAGFDASNLSESENIQMGINPEYKFNKGRVVLNASYAKTDRDFTSSSPGEYFSKTFMGDLFSSYKFSNNLQVVLGVNAQQHKMEQATTPFGGNSIVTDITEETADVTLIDPYLNAVYNFDFGLNLSAGIRLNNHSNYGSHLVYNINPSYVLTINDKLTSKFLASYSTSFIAPTLFQQYSPDYGNDELDPQESRNGEFGVEFYYNKKYRFSAVAFHREDENFIDFVNVYDDSGNWIGGLYDNVEDDAIKTQGVELETSLPLYKSLSLNANYTFVQHETDDLSRRVPKHKANANLSYVLKEKTTLSLAYQFTDKRLEGIYNPSTFSVENVGLDAYSLVNLFVSHDLTNNLSLNASLFNMFDEEYVELTGFSTRGRNYKLGLRLKF